MNNPITIEINVNGHKEKLVFNVNAPTNTTHCTDSATGEKIPTESFCKPEELWNTPGILHERQRQLSTFSARRATEVVQVHPPRGVNEPACGFAVGDRWVSTDGLTVRVIEEVTPQAVLYRLHRMSKHNPAQSFNRPVTKSRPVNWRNGFSYYTTYPRVCYRNGNIAPLCATRYEESQTNTAKVEASINDSLPSKQTMFARIRELEFELSCTKIARDCYWEKRNAHLQTIARLQARIQSLENSL